MSREMKHSGMPWIGEIPKHWTVELIGNSIKEVDCPNSDNAENNALQFKLGTIISKSTGDSKYNPMTLEAYNKVRIGDIVINGLNLSFDFISQRVGLVKENGVITSAYLTLRTFSNIDSAYLTYLFKAYDTCKAFHGMGKGLRQTLSYKELRTYSVCYPPLVEQQAIADFLDKKCNEIDELVALQEKMIEELKAYKQSVITEAVCKGLNPNVPMKDSGVDWIGEIPEAWSIVKLGLLTSKIGSGSTPSGGAEVYTEDGVKFMRSQNVYFEGFDLTNVAHISQEIDEQMQSTRVYKGDILFNITGGSIGRCCDVDATLGAANVNQHVCIVRPTKILTKYLKYYLQSNSGQTQVRLLQTGGNRDGLSADAFKKFLILVPTCSEQEEIADYLDKKCSEIDQLISIKQQKIVELNDYKKSLIYEYATGKKEVKL